jgi:hypothetical protein
MLSGCVMVMFPTSSELGTLSAIPEFETPRYKYRLAVLRRDDPCLDDLGQHLIGAAMRPFNTRISTFSLTEALALLEFAPLARNRNIYCGRNRLARNGKMVQ